MGMNNVLNLQPPVQQLPDVPLAAPTYITPDCLLAYCSSRLQNLDAQMQTQFQTQQTGIADSQALQDIEQKLKDYFTSVGKDSNGNLIAPVLQLDEDTRNAIQNDIDKIQDPNAQATAQNALNQMVTLKAGQGFDDFKSAVLDGLDAGQQSLSQGQELGMIGLQSIMSQRQTAVQMTTNLMQSLGDQLKSVADNVGK